MMTQTSSDDRAALAAQRDRLDLEARALRRELDAEDLPLAPTFEETMARRDREQRLKFLQETYRDLSGRIEAIDLAARRAEAEKDHLRDYTAGLLNAARSCLARVANDEDENAVVQASLARCRALAVGEIAALEAQLRTLEPPPSTMTAAPATSGPKRETKPVRPTEPTSAPRVPAPSIAPRVRSELVWSADPNDDVDPGTEEM